MEQKKSFGPIYGLRFRTSDLRRRASDFDAALRPDWARIQWLCVKRALKGRALLGAISRYPLLLLGHSYLVACGVSAAIGGAAAHFQYFEYFGFKPSDLLGILHLGHIRGVRAR